MHETTKIFQKFNATGRCLLIKFRAPVEEQEPTAFLKECIIALTNYIVHDVRDRNLVAISFHNTENVQDKVVWISFRPCDHFKPDVVWGVLGKVIQSNASDRLEVHLDHIRMRAGNGREKRECGI